jgi:two-component system, LytTR family, sensor kinase
VVVPGATPVPPALRVALGLAAWTLVGLFFATQTFTGAAYTGRPLTWPQALAVALGAWYVRAALSPVVRQLARRWPIARPALARRVALHAAAALAWGVATTAVIQSGPVQWALAALADVPRRAMSPVELHTGVLTYAVLVGLTQGADYYRRYRDRELAASRLEAQLATARLDVLRMQLNPHFLFNTLHDLTQLMHEDVDRAESMLEHLSELLRLSLRHIGEPEVTLREEVDFLRRYLELEQMRYQDRLETRLDVEPAALDARVPYLILQPLVENAVRHGVAPRSAPGRVEVVGRARDGVLVLEVCDDGPGLAPAAGVVNEGIGLRNTRARLRESYGAAYRFDITDLAGGGLRATLELPLRTGGVA